MSLDTSKHPTKLEDYQAEAVSLVNIAISGEGLYAKRRLQEIISEVWNRLTPKKPEMRLHD